MWQPVLVVKSLQSTQSTGSIFRLEVPIGSTTVNVGGYKKFNESHLKARLYLLLLDVLDVLSIRDRL